MVVASAPDLLAALRAGDFLTPEQFAALGNARFANARVLARELLVRGWLTKFQLTQLVNDRGDALTLGAYRLLDRLGEGGMGQVYKALQLRLDRVVALKVIRPEMLGEDRAVRRFRREAKAVARLAHPNIVSIFDADEADGTHFLVMEYVDGTDLDRLVKGRGPLPVAAACEYARQAALGLQHAHTAGLVHRDIKPGNLLLMRTADPPVVKLLDLGLARSVDPAAGGPADTSLTQMRQVIGTPDYMAPEQARQSSAAGPPADLYALGATLYFLLTGRPPLPATSAMAAMLRHQFDPPPPLREARPDAPPELEALIDRLLAKAPADRPGSAAEVAAALAPFASGSTTHVVVPLDGEATLDFPALDLPPAPSSLPTRRRWGRGPLAGLVAAVALLVVGLFALRSPSKPVEATGPAPSRSAPTGFASATAAATKPAPRTAPKPAAPLPTAPADIFRQILPEDTGMVAFADVVRVRESGAFRRHVAHPDTDFRLPMGPKLDLVRQVDRLILAASPAGPDRFLLVVQGSLLTPETVAWMNAHWKAESFALPGGKVRAGHSFQDAQRRPRFVCPLWAGVLGFSGERAYLESALARAGRRWPAKLSDPYLSAVVPSDAPPRACWLAAGQAWLRRNGKPGEAEGIIGLRAQTELTDILQGQLEVDTTRPADLTATVGGLQFVLQVEAEKDKRLALFAELLRKRKVTSTVRGSGVTEVRLASGLTAEELGRLLPQALKRPG